MIHVVTVHFMDDRWIGPQLRALKRHLGPDHRVTACLNGIDPAWNEVFHSAHDLEGTHALKLNALAKIVADSGAAPDDLLLFIDGDAFPIATVDAGLLDGVPLTAVRRDEHLQDRQPHPCFCLTTVGFWHSIGGDWEQGHTWRNETGESVSDVGGNLLGILEAAQISWRPLLRSNRIDLDPLFFGIYGDVVYHHGAGFRIPKSRQMMIKTRQEVLWAASGAHLPSWVPVLGRAERSIRYRLADRQQRRGVSTLAAKARDLAEDVYRELETDDEFFRRFQ